MMGDIIRATVANGDVLRGLDGEPLTVVSVTSAGRADEVYNLDVEDFHTYFVGADPVWTHNCRAGKAPRGAVRTSPQNLAEKLTLDEAKGGAGKRIMQGKINDPM